MRGVICISSEDGADAASAALAAAKELGYRLVDEDIVTRAAIEAGVDREVVADVERRQTLIERILDSLAAAGGGGMGYGMAAAPPVGGDAPRSDELRGLIRAVIEETASQGSVVIVAHAASFALDRREDVLRVLVTASPQTRARRIAGERGISESEAEKLLRRSDAGREDYLKRFYGVERELPSHYDLILSTDRVSAAQAAELVVHAAGQDEQPA